MLLFIPHKPSSITLAHLTPISDAVAAKSLAVSIAVDTATQLATSHAARSTDAAAARKLAKTVAISSASILAASVLEIGSLQSQLASMAAALSTSLEKRQEDAAGE